MGTPTFVPMQCQLSTVAPHPPHLASFSAEKSHLGESEWPWFEHQHYYADCRSFHSQTEVFTLHSVHMNQETNNKPDVVQRNGILKHWTYTWWFDVAIGQQNHIHKFLLPLFFILEATENVIFSSKKTENIILNSCTYSCFPLQNNLTEWHSSIRA